MQYEIGKEYDFVKVITKSETSAMCQCGFNLYSNIGTVKAVGMTRMRCIEKGLVPKVGSLHRRIPGKIFQDVRNNFWYHSDSDAQATNDITKQFQCFSIYTTHDVDHGHNDLLGHVRLYEKNLYLEELERAISAASQEEDRKTLEKIRGIILGTELGVMKTQFIPA